MPKTKISEFSSTPANNTDIDSINIAEGCAPSGINDAIRELMAQLKDWQSGTSNDPYVVGSSGSLTLNQGTANTVPYLNGSKVVTSGSALSFDGTNLGVGVAPSAWGSGYRAIDLGAGSSLWAQNTGSPSTFLSANVYYNGTNFIYKTSTYSSYYLQNSGNGQHQWYTAPSGTAGNAITFTQAMTLDASGNLGIGTTVPTQVVSVGLSAGTKGFNIVYPVDNSELACFTANGSTGEVKIGGISASYFPTFYSGGSERARIDTSGDFIVGTSGTGRAIIAKQDSDGEGWNGASTALYVGKVNGTGRSINAGGTINASGADYAEYMTKAGNFTVAKGDLVGIDAQGKLTNVFANALSFVVKSTDPSYVGGDIWGVGLEGDELEAARQTVDRIAFAGQVPVNVLGATAGQFIIPVNDNGSIKGQAVSNPTFEQYQFAVGKVIAIESDGRARIIVKVA